MGLAGILTIALIVSADQSYAGIDGLRAVTAYPPTSEQDQAAKPSVPVLSGLSGLLDGIRELPIFGLSPSPDATALAGGSPSAPASGAPAPSTQPGSPSRTPADASPAPGGAPSSPAPSTPAPSTPAPSQAPTQGPATPAPTTTPTPAPSSTPTPTPSGTPAPALTLATDRGATAVVTLGDLVPGDTIIRTITLKNTGSLGFKYAVSATQTASTLLWTDATNGLQLTVATGTGTVLYSGPIAGLGSLASATVMAPGATELLRYTFDFPAGAPDIFQSLIQDLTLVFTATQYP